MKKLFIYILLPLLIGGIAWVVWTKNPAMFTINDASDGDGQLSVEVGTQLNAEQASQLITGNTFKGEYADQLGNTVYYAQFFSAEGAFTNTDTNQPLEYGGYTVRDDGCVFIKYHIKSMYRQLNGCMFITKASGSQQYEASFPDNGDQDRAATLMSGNHNDLISVKVGSKLRFQQWSETNEFLQPEQVSALLVNKTQLTAYVNSTREKIAYSEHYASDGSLEGIDAEWGPYKGKYELRDDGCVFVNYNGSVSSDGCLYFSKVKPLNESNPDETQYAVFYMTTHAVEYLDTVEGKNLKLAK